MNARLNTSASAMPGRRPVRAGVVDRRAHRDVWNEEAEPDAREDEERVHEHRALLGGSVWRAEDDHSRSEVFLGLRDIPERLGEKAELDRLRRDLTGRDPVESHDGVE